MPLLIKTTSIVSQTFPTITKDTIFPARLLTPLTNGNWIRLHWRRGARASAFEAQRHGLAQCQTVAFRESFDKWIRNSASFSHLCYGKHTKSARYEQFAEENGVRQKGFQVYKRAFIQFIIFPQRRRAAMLDAKCGIHLPVIELAGMPLCCAVIIHGAHTIYSTPCTILKKVEIQYIGNLRNVFLRYLWNRWCGWLARRKRIVPHKNPLFSAWPTESGANTFYGAGSTIRNTPFASHWMGQIAIHLLFIGDERQEQWESKHIGQLRAWSDCYCFVAHKWKLLASVLYSYFLCWVYDKCEKVE